MNLGLKFMNLIHKSIDFEFENLNEKYVIV